MTLNQNGIALHQTAKNNTNLFFEEYTMKPILIGSEALKRHVSLQFKTTDLDLICLDKFTAEQYIQTNLKEAEFVKLSKSVKFSTETLVYLENDKHIEITYPVSLDCSTALLFSLLGSEIIEHEDFLVPSLNLLYTIKLSHRFLKDSPHFKKTRNHCRFFERNGAKLTCLYWYDKRISETYDYNSYKLNVSSKDFFNSNFNYIYCHDDIHEAVKLLDRPAYTKYMEDDAEVLCSQRKFYEQPFAVRIAGVLEETYVLALERSQIQTDFTVDPKTSFLIALEKVCTSITSGWFRDFAWNHYFIIAEMYDPSYISKFKIALDSGIVKIHESNTITQGF